MRVSVHPVRLSSATDADDEEFLEIQLKPTSDSDDTASKSSSARESNAQVHNACTLVQTSASAASPTSANSSDSSSQSSSVVTSPVSLKEKSETEATEKILFPDGTNTQDEIARDVIKSETGNVDCKETNDVIAPVHTLTEVNLADENDSSDDVQHRNASDVKTNLERQLQIEADSSDAVTSPAEVEPDELLGGEERFSWREDRLVRDDVSSTANSDVIGGHLSFSLSDSPLGDKNAVDGSDVIEARESAQFTRTDSVGSRTSQASFVSVASDLGAL